MILKRINVTSPFGIRKHPVTHQPRSFHSGADFAANYENTYAISDGKVVSCIDYDKMPVGTIGKCMIIQHYGFCSVYGHLSEFKCMPGELVKKGELVAVTGNTGVTDGAHLHFEIRETDYNRSTFWKKEFDGRYHKAVDPVPYVLGQKPVKERWEQIVESLSVDKDWVDEIKGIESQGGLKRFIGALIEKIYDGGKNEKI